MGTHDPMSESYACRLCFGVCRVQMSLTPTPLANSFAEYPDRDAPQYPLELQECLDCGHVQLKQHMRIDWQDYAYRTPAANTVHLAMAAQAIKDRYPLAKSVLEIGSNNGLYLEALKEQGFTALGVDPNTTVGIAAPFSDRLATGMAQQDVIVANNVLAHVDDLWDVFRGIDRLLPEHGALVFEVQDFECLLESGAFDMIYHEHRDYHTLEPLVPFLRRFGLVVVKVEHLPTHGGSMRVWCERPGVSMPIAWAPEIDWRRFSRRIREAKAHVLDAISDVQGPIACFGAAAKATTLLHHFGLTDLMDYCVDDTPEKQGKYLPGTAIRIHPTAYLQTRPPAAVLMTAWNFAEVLTASYPSLNWIIPFRKEVLCPRPLSMLA